MKRMHIVYLLAILGLGLAVAAIQHDNRPVSVKNEGIPQFSPPFASFVAGGGIIEAPTGNIAIGTPVAGIVMEIPVKVGDHVKVGDPLFRIDDRDLQAQLLTANARVSEAAAALQKPRHRIEIAERLFKLDSGAISEQDRSDLRDDATLAEAALELARAQLAQLRLEIERHTVRALVAGKVLQLKMRPGEFVDGSSAAAPLLLLGGDDRLNVRVDVDEHDAWRVRPGAEAVAFVRGHPELKIPLRYEFTEPYIVPKLSLTGLSAEQTDTRVLQVMYSFVPAELPVYAGQQLDVFIRAAEPNASGARP